MLVHLTWDNRTLSDVSANGPNYMYSLLCDYERYVKSFGYIPVELFLQDWKCITYNAFAKLTPGDYIYTPQGVQYRVVDEPYESDDELSLYVEVTMVKPDGSIDTNTEILQSGDIYSEDVTHGDYRRKRPRDPKEREEKVCPILITKTNQPQS